MGKTKYWLSILAISVVLIAGSLAVSPIAIADDDDDDETPISFVWDPADSSPDPNNLIVISGSFSRAGLLSDTTTDVAGEVEGLLKGDSENNSETTVTTMIDSTTITTTVKAKSQDANDLEGEISIDGVTYATKLTLLASKTTTLEVSEVFSGPTFSQSLMQEKLTIPVTIEMCVDDDQCFQGFGVIRREVSATESEGSTITFSTDELEAELINDTGLFELKLSKLQRTVEVVPP